MNVKFPGPPSRTQKGVTLVIVLAVLVLVVGIVVAFLATARVEERAAGTFLASSATRQLADNCVSIVQSQINLGTSDSSGSAWASQPGAIRTYATNGSPGSVYKLYSASSLIAGDPTSLANDVPPASWAGQPAIWVDLNAPVTRDNQSLFPIVDGRVATAPTNDRPRGFEINNAPGATPDQPAPMPVRWLYVLEDGQIVAPSNSSGAASIPGASATNRITGRIAFWADDESAKVNLNTAGVGGFWDVPRYNSAEDRKFSTSQPLNGEFQRYPGHPAMTSLSAVFPSLTDQQILETITPRYQWGGSQQGAADTYTLRDALNSGNVATLPLYPTVDELRMRPGRGVRTSNTTLPTSLDNTEGFFLTTSSRAPELNLFGLPRVAVWPITVGDQRQTAFDRTIAFCSTIAGEPFYFQRTDSSSPTADAAISRNLEIYEYLRRLLGQNFPGFGVSLGAKFGADLDQILVQIWDYVRTLNLHDSRLDPANAFTPADQPNQSDGGHGFVFPLQVTRGSETYQGFGRSVTLSELAFVFICTADSAPPPTGSGGQPDPNLVSNDPATNPTLQGTALSSGQRRIQMLLIPELFSVSQGNTLIKPKHLRVTIEGLANLRLTNASGTPEPLFSVNSASVDLVPGAFNWGWGTRALGGTFDFRALLMGYDAGGPSYPFASNYVTVGNAPTTWRPSNSGTMNFQSGVLTVTLQSSPDGTNWTTMQTIQMQPPSGDLPIPNLVTNGFPKAAPRDWWGFDQTRRLSKIDTNLGQFRVVPSGQTNAGIAYASGPGQSTIFRTPEGLIHTDIVRSMVPTHGDFRLLAALPNVPSGVFGPTENWSAAGPANALMHNLRAGAMDAAYIPGSAEWARHPVTDATIGADPLFGRGGQYAPDFPRNAPLAVVNAVTDRGDFDNATAFWPDGAFINKPDEGNVLAGSDNPYYDDTERAQLEPGAFFSPNRMMPGAGMFGSLPTHVRRYAADIAAPQAYAWRTLLFRRQSTASHPNAVASTNSVFGTAPDHLLMDLFWMPTVEPYAISEPFSTAGKINMNFEIRPFTYIRRTTGLHALFEDERIPAVPDANRVDYKTILFAAPSIPNSFRLPIDASATISQFDQRFAANRLFLSPTELCDLWLVPQGQSVGSMEQFWAAHKLTGDNMRERPYTTIIPRLTTKSNSFTVHYIVQALRSPLTAPQDAWDETKGTIASELRGAVTIERYIDPLDPRFQGIDFAAADTDVSLADFYRWRTLSSTTFSP